IRLRIGNLQRSPANAKSANFEPKWSFATPSIDQLWNMPHYLLKLLKPNIWRNNMQQLQPYTSISANQSSTLPEKSATHEAIDIITVTAQSKICAACHKNPVKKFCGRCKVVYYCDANCQR